MTKCQAIIPKRQSRLTQEEDLAHKILKNMKKTLEM